MVTILIPKYKSRGAVNHKAMGRVSCPGEGVMPGRGCHARGRVSCPGEGIEEEREGCNGG